MTDGARRTTFEAFLHQLERQHQRCEIPCELKHRCEGFVGELLGTMFPHLARVGGRRPHGVRATFEVLGIQLAELVEMAGVEVCQAKQVAAEFIGALPAIHEDLWNDAKAIHMADPAANSVHEVVLAYPGFFAIAVHRLAHLLERSEVPLVPRLMSEYAHRGTGIDIHPGAEIGAPFVIDHGTGVVIGQSTQIGKRVVLYQGVTLGALAVHKRSAGTKRHPTVEDDVVIYAGATILGGQTVIGARSVIGGNVWLTESVEPDSVVTNTHEVRVRPRKSRRATEQP